MPRFAPTVLRSADLSSPFGYDLAVRWFGQEAVDSLPVRASGKNKGSPKGFVLWLSTTAAGYHPNAGCAVGANTTVRAWIGTSAYTPEAQAVRGKWLGREQSICGSRDLLGADNRARWIAEEARIRA
jgi:hypothetical protein